MCFLLAAKWKKDYKPIIHQRLSFNNRIQFLASASSFNKATTATGSVALSRPPSNNDIFQFQSYGNRKCIAVPRKKGRYHHTRTSKQHHLYHTSHFNGQHKISICSMNSRPSLGSSTSLAESSTSLAEWWHQ